MKPDQVQCPTCGCDKTLCYDLVRGELFPIGISHKARIDRAARLEGYEKTA